MRKFVINRSFSINSDKEFRDYAHNVMKQAHGDEYSEEVTNKVVDDLLADNPGADYGELIGRLTSGFGEKKTFSSRKYTLFISDSENKVLAVANRAWDFESSKDEKFNREVNERLRNLRQYYDFSFGDEKRIEDYSNWCKSKGFKIVKFDLSELKSDDSTRKFLANNGIGVDE